MQEARLEIIRLEISENCVKSDCVELVTVNGRFNFTVSALWQ